MERFLRNFDFYRKVPADLTKATATGTCISFCGIFILVALFFAELSSFMTVRDRFEIAMSENSVLDDMLQVNLNISLPHLPCKFASIDITDVTHTRRLNVTKNLRKWTLTKDGKKEEMDRTLEK